MKKISKIFIIIVSSIIILGNFMTVRAEVKPGDTLKDLRNQLKDLQNKRTAQQNEKKKTEAEIAANRNKMIQASNELEETKSKMSEITEEIDRTNRDIDDVKGETEELLRLYQKLESENIYTSYITGASSMTELIMRMEVINQLSDYNDQKISELELMIKSNEKLNKELEKYQVTLGNKIVAYEDAIAALGDDLGEIELGVVDINKQISSLQESIKTYETIGCGENQEILQCVNVANSKGWLKPVSQGRINSVYGYRTSPTPGASSNHKGIDIGVAEGTPAYGTANGTVGAIVRGSSCGGNMVFVWAYVNNKPYTYVFMHLLEIKVNVGDPVTINTVVGLSGGGSTASRNGGYDKCTTGAHLHYGLAEGGFYDSSNFNAHTINPPGYPGLYQWFYSR